MSILSNIKSILSSSAKSVGDIFNGQTWTPFTLNRTGSSARSLLNADNGWVHVCVDMIAGSLSGIDIKLMKATDGDKSDEQIYSHPILDLLAKPNDFIDGRELFYHTHGHAELTGNAYWRKVDGKLIPVPPSNCEPKISSDGLSIKEYEIRTKTGGKITVPADEMYHYRYPNLSNPFIGAGVAEKISDWIDVEKFATEFNRSFFENGGTVGDVLQTKATTLQEIDIIRKGWEMKHRGMRNAHNAAILPDGTTLAKGGQSMRDMQFSELDSRYRDKILAAFGVPKSILGITESGMSRADAEAKNYSFAFFTLEPKMHRFVEWLNNTVVKDMDNTGRLYLDFDSIVPEDKTHDLEVIKAGTGGQAFMTLNEARERSGLAPVEDGDEIPQASPFGTLSVGKEKETVSNKKKRRVPSSVKAKDDLASTLAKTINASGVQVKSKSFTESEETAHEADLQKRYVRVEPYELLVTETMKGINDEQKRRARKWARENIKDGKGLINNKKASDVLDHEAEMNLTIELISPTLSEILAKEGEATMMTVNPVVQFDPNNAKTAEAFQRYIGVAADSYTSTTIAALEDTITEGVADGENVREIEKRINEVFEYSDTVRAELMAKTTTFEISNQATEQAFIQSGIVKTKKWYTAQDERVCPMCEPLHGKEIEIETTFYDEGDNIVGSNSEAFIGIGHPPVHPRCRCTIVAGQIDYGKAGTETSTKDIEPQPAAQSEVESEQTFLKEILSTLENQYHEQSTATK